MNTVILFLLCLRTIFHDTRQKYYSLSKSDVVNLTSKKYRLIEIIFGVVVGNFLLIIFFRRCYIDEPWLGEYAYWLAETGKVKSQLFSSLPGYGDQIFVYHKLFTLISAAVIDFAGFGLWQLRGVNFFFLLILLFFLYRFGRKLQLGRPWRLVLLVLFLANPLTINFGSIFRPEVMVTCFGFISYFYLQKALMIGKPSRYLCLAAVMAGLAAFSHLNGLIFLAAGSVLLIWSKKTREFLIFGAVGGMVFLCYFWDVLLYREWDIFLHQFQNDPAIVQKSKAWYSPFLNLLKEHQRWFRNIHLVGLHVLLAYFILFAGRYLKHRHAGLLIYMFTLYLALGLLSPLKTTKYMLYMLPFVCIVLTLGFRFFYCHMPLALKKAVLVFGILYLGAGAVTSGQLYMDGGRGLIEKNEQLSGKLKKGSAIIAPLPFIFGQIDQFVIHGLHYHKSFYNQYLGNKEPEDYKNIFVDGIRKNIEYILINKKNIFPLEIVPKHQPGYAILFEDADWIVYQQQDPIKR